MMKRILKRLPTLATLGALIVIAACSSDNALPVAPAIEASATLTPALPALVAAEAVVAEQIDASAVSPHGTYAISYPSGAQMYQFTHDPNYSASYIIGVHMVSFPRSSICDPAQSTYGTAYWQTDCVRLSSRITITAMTYTDSDGRPQIDFQNAIRFVPGANGQLPAIYLRDPAASMSSFSRIDYCDADNVCVNEANEDSMLRTQRHWYTGYLYRFIRHFSGYNVWA